MPVRVVRQVGDVVCTDDDVVDPGAGIGRKRGKRQQEEPYRASPYPAGSAKRRGAEQAVGHRDHRRGWGAAEHPHGAAAEEDREGGEGHRREHLAGVLEWQAGGRVLYIAALHLVCVSIWTMYLTELIHCVGVRENAQERYCGPLVLMGGVRRRSNPSLFCLFFLDVARTAVHEAWQATVRGFGAGEGMCLQAV